MNANTRRRVKLWVFSGRAAEGQSDSSHSQQKVGEEREGRVTMFWIVRVGRGYTVIQVVGNKRGYVDRGSRTYYALPRDIGYQNLNRAPSGSSQLQMNRPKGFTADLSQSLGTCDWSTPVCSP